MTLPLLLALALTTGAAAPGSPVASGAPAQDSDAGTWRQLEVPELCRWLPPGRYPLFPANTHLALPSELDPDRVSPRVAPRLPLESLLELLESDARRAGGPLRIHRPAPPLVVHGPPAALERAARTLVELDAHGARQAIELRAWLLPERLPTGAESPVQLDAAALASLVGERPPSAVAQVRSGQRVVLGSQSETSYVADFEVEVAQMSGAAEPVVGRALTGHAIDARAWRIEQGRAVFLSGTLDLAWLEGTERFDPQAPELGIVEQPRVRFTQVKYSGRVPAGGALRVALRGLDASLAGSADWTLFLSATTQRDLEDGAWRCRNVAFLDATSYGLELPAPGPTDAPKTVHRARSEPFPAAALWAEAERASSGGSSRVPLLVYAPGLLVGSTDADALWRSLDGLITAAEDARAATRHLRVRHGAFEAELPVSAFAPVRVWHGLETSALVRYTVELAAETWMPKPQVTPVIDGVLVQGVLSSGELGVACWRARSGPAEIRGRGETTHGRLALPRRSFESAVRAVREGAGPVPLLAGAPASLGTSAESGSGAVPGGAPALSAALSRP